MRSVNGLISAVLALVLGFWGRPASALLVAVDVGHAQSKPGATSARGVPEFEFNRALALAVADELRAHGATVQMIGDDGKATDLWKRSPKADGADLFLSIHHDSAQPQYLETIDVDGRRGRVSRRFTGFSLFVSRKNPHSAESLKCASAIGAALRTAGFVPSPHHAEKIPGENRPFADEANGVYYFDDLIVLRSAHVPAVLLEGGIIINPEDELVLREPATREKIAKAVMSALGCLSHDASHT
jgi:N-acetylmuramoyl-L-alanine amidase